MNCSNCGMDIGDNKICPICGQVNERSPEPYNVTDLTDKKKDAFLNRNFAVLPKLIVIVLLLIAMSIFMLRRGADGGGSKGGTATANSGAGENAGGREEPDAETAGSEEKPDAAEAETVKEDSDYIVDQDAVNKLVTLDANIPKNADTFQGHSYYIYDDGCETWNDARRNCESRGGYLAVINSKEENDHLFDYMIMENQDEVFFGFTDQGSEGTWKWVSGKESNFTDWGTNSEGSREPNADSDYEDYAHMNSAMHDGHWNDKRFGKTTSYYFCEWNLINYQGKDCKGTAIQDKVPMRNNSRDDADVIVNLKQKEEVQILFLLTKDNGKQWYYVQHKSGVIGYVNSELLEVG